jgi:hypothetical protein
VDDRLVAVLVQLSDEQRASAGQPGAQRH